jgi:Tol biopolymer transport system component
VIAAMLAICLLTLVAPPNTAEADDSNTKEAADSRRYNGKIAFNHDDALYAVEPDGSNPTQLLNDTFKVDGAVWSPDGTKIAYSHRREPSGFSAISVMNADGSGRRHLYTTTIRSLPEPTWSPDGTKLAFNNALPDLNQDIFVMDRDGSNLTNLTGIGEREAGGDELAPAFSPDGKQMCFLLDTYTNNPPTGLYVMDADGSDPTALVTLVDHNDLPTDILFGCTWSPDGTKIAYSFSPEHEVIVLDLRRGRHTNLTRNSAADTVPDWSPDGKKIAFASDRDGDFDIYTMDANGSDVAQVTNLHGVDYAPDWQPLTPESRSMTVSPPDTGGPSLLLVASALLFSVGFLLSAVVKRGM